MLSPHDRTALFDALRPPPGFVLDHSVGTSFTLDLEALLTAPIAFALFESQDTSPDQDGLEPVGLLEAIRRHASRITMFCQSGQIAVPSRHRTVFAWLEAAVHEVTPPRRYRLFHPKVWLARYRARSGDRRVLRLLCATRNLTLDTSWDTLLQLESDPYDQRPYTTQAPHQELVELIRRLPDMAVRSVGAERRAAIDDLAADLAAVRLAVPEPFESLRMRVLGLGAQSDDVVPADVERALVISPFVTESWLRGFTERAGASSVLISREESLDRVPADVLEAFERVAVLNPAADVPPQSTSAATATSEKAPVSDDTGNPARLFGGLHAKLFVFDTPDGSVVLTGSANATDAAFGGNVEVVAELRGPADSGVDLFLVETPGEADLADLLVDYRLPDMVVEASDTEALALAVDELRRRIAAVDFEAKARWVGDDFELSFASTQALPSLDSASDSDADVELTVRPITLADRQAATRLTLGQPADARFGVTLEGLSAFFAMTLTARRAGTSMSTTFMVTTELVGAPADRESRLLAAMLRDPDRLLRYLMLLLSDADPMLGAGDGSGATTWLRGWRGSAWDDIPLLELLVRAADRFPDRLDHIELLLRDLGEQRDTVLPKGFEDIWEPVMRFCKTPEAAL
jgi:hypothetical protein